MSSKSPPVTRINVIRMIHIPVTLSSIRPRAIRHRSGSHLNRNKNPTKAVY
ncbi:hypothetical protein Hanom_Chr15g01403341 [Helianthus anomalus]